jgi:hypothetical protein
MAMAPAVRVLRHAATSEHEAAAIGESKARKRSSCSHRRAKSGFRWLLLPASRGSYRPILAPSALACAVVT